MSAETAVPRILIVEDEKIVAMDAAARLEGLGYQVVGTASSGEDALRAAAELRPDLALMDIGLRGAMDGTQAARLLKEQLGIPVVFLTAYADPATLERAKISEPLGYVLKPFSERELHAALEMALYRGRMERKLREGRRWFETTLRSLTDGVVASDSSGRITFLNPAAERMTGVPRQEAVGRTLVTVVDLRDDTGMRREPFSSLQSEGLVRGRDGRETPVETRRSPIQDEMGTTIGTVLVLSDLTERRRHEQALREHEERLRHSQKMEAIGRLAGGVAHDFNNMLTAILGYTDLVLWNADEGDPSREALQEIRRAGERASALTKQLLAFSRKQASQPQVVNLNRLVSGSASLLRRLIGEDIVLVTHLDPVLPRVKVDPNQLEQVLVNLAVNARDAMTKGGVLRIETAHEEIGSAPGSAPPADEVGEHPYVVPGHYVLLRMTDNGTGMDRELRQHVFEPFFTTKERGKGTGLGLAIVYGIVKQSRGYVWASSQPGRGTSFSIYLPVTEEVSSPSLKTIPSSPSERSPGGRTERVLLVEDELLVRTLVRKVLAGEGLEVHEAPNGPAALRLLAEQEQPFHLLVTDLVMPLMSGRDVAAEVARVRPGIKILYMSGYADQLTAEAGLSPQGSVLLKPFLRDDLVRAVHELLEGPAAAGG